MLIAVMLLNTTIVFATSPTSRKKTDRIIIEEELTEEEKAKYEKHTTDYSLYENSQTQEEGITTRGSEAPVGTTRVVTTSEFVNGTLYQYQKEEHPVASIIWNVGMFVFGNYINTVGNIIVEVASVVHGVSSTEISTSQLGVAITYYSYGYISKLGQVVDHDYTWDTKFETEKRYVYAHEFASYVHHNKTKTGTVDKGVTDMQYVNSSHYNSDSYIRNRTYTIWLNNYNDEYELFY